MINVVGKAGSRAAGEKSLTQRFEGLHLARLESPQWYVGGARLRRCQWLFTTCERESQQAHAAGGGVCQKLASGSGEFRTCT